MPPVTVPENDATGAAADVRRPGPACGTRGRRRPHARASRWAVRTRIPSGRTSAPPWRPAASLSAPGWPPDRSTGIPAPPGAPSDSGAAGAPRRRIARDAARPCAPRASPTPPGWPARAGGCEEKESGAAGRLAQVLGAEPDEVRPQFGQLVGLRWCQRERVGREDPADRVHVKPIHDALSRGRQLVRHNRRGRRAVWRSVARRSI